MKRKSLAELQHEDEIQEGTDTGKKIEPAPGVNNKSQLLKNNSEIINNKSEKTPKADYVKMSITVEPDLFDAVLKISHNRRKKKLPFSYSLIIRDALKDYLMKIKEEI